MDPNKNHNNIIEYYYYYYSYIIYYLNTLFNIVKIINKKVINYINLLKKVYKNIIIKKILSFIR